MGATLLYRVRLKRALDRGVVPHMGIHPAILGYIRPHGLVFCLANIDEYLLAM